MGQGRKPTPEGLLLHEAVSPTQPNPPFTSPLTSCTVLAEQRDGKLDAQCDRVRAAYRDRVHLHGVTVSQLHSMTECRPHRDSRDSVRAAHHHSVRATLHDRVCATQRDTGPAAQRHKVPAALCDTVPLCNAAGCLQHSSIRTCTGVDTLPLHHVLAHGGSSTPGQPSANDPYPKPPASPPNIPSPPQSAAICHPLPPSIPLSLVNQCHDVMIWASVASMWVR